MQSVWIGLAGFAGAIARYQVEGLVSRNARGAFPWGTLVVNVSGCFVLGLLITVLTERVRWAVAFKTVIFLPMAISAFATGVTWRLVYQQDPSVGAANALGKVIVDAVNPPGVLSSAATCVLTAS